MGFLQHVDIQIAGISTEHFLGFSLFQFFEKFSLLAFVFSQNALVNDQTIQTIRVALGNEIGLILRHCAEN